EERRTASGGQRVHKMPLPIPENDDRVLRQRCRGDGYYEALEIRNEDRSALVVAVPMLRNGATSSRLTIDYGFHHRTIDVCLAVDCSGAGLNVNARRSIERVGEGRRPAVVRSHRNRDHLRHAVRRKEGLGAAPLTAPIDLERVRFVGNEL